MSLADDYKTKIDALVAANDEAGLVNLCRIVKFWVRPACDQALGSVHDDYDTLKAERKAELVVLASQALADDTEAQINAWVAAHDEASLVSFARILKFWIRPAKDQALGAVHDDYDVLKAERFADLDALLA